MADDSSSDDGEKTEEPSQYRIDEFRKRGEVASSKELSSVLVLSAACLTLILSLVYIHEEMSNFIIWLYSLDLEKAFTTEGLQEIMGKTVLVGLKSTGPVFLVALCVGVFANIAQIGILFSPEVLELKLDRIDPLKGMKRLFSMRSLVEAIKSVAKFVFILAVVYFFLKDDILSYQGFLHMGLFESFLHGKWIIGKLFFTIISSVAVIAVGDFAYQKISYRNRLRQTKEQAKQEHKEKEGSPELRQRIRSVQREMAQRRAMSEVPKADVIVTNPTHLSIALRYDPATMVSPEVIAKGADNIAMKIREIAKEHDIPIVENVPLARTLFKTVKEGQAVPHTLYKAVAEVLAFVYKLKRKKKALGA